MEWTEEEREELKGRVKRAEESGERFGRFVGRMFVFVKNLLKGIVFGLGLIFAAILIFHLF